ncbi:MAG: peptidoglycan D,D-transpeptidase FtsI family protein [Bacillota bacterium]
MRVKMAQRMLWLSVIALGVFGSLGLRVFQLQIEGVDRGHDLLETVYSQRTQSLSLQMRRGRILDRNGVDLTDPESSFGLGLFPKLLGDPAEAAQRLSAVLSPHQVALVLEHASKSPEPAWVLEGLSAPVRERLERLKLPGLVTGPTGRRYGAESLARHLVGYASEQGGQQGLERAYEGELVGDRVPYLVATFDGRDRPLFPIRRMLPETGKEPYDLFTTLDARMQRVVEQEMDAGGAMLRGAVVVMEARSGEVLALASRPNFNQMRISGDERDSPLVNRALLAYEPGSVFKSLVAAAALEEGKVSLDESFDCQGHYELGGLTFGDANGEGHGSITFREAVARSCNITFIQVGYERLGAAKLLEAARRFGLGSPTGIYPGADESAGRLPPLAYGGDVAQFSFGQGGLMVTPVQVARAYAAIANGGILPPVRVVTAAKKPSGVVMARPETGQARRVISRETARELQEALQGVTDPTGRGTGRAAWVEGQGSAGKTGSAETVHDGRPVTHAWFAGWTPVESPRYVIVVLVEDGKSGGLAAAPLFRRIAEGIHGL